MDSPGFFQRRWKWLLPLIVFAPLALMSTKLLTAYTRNVEMPHLAGQKINGATPAACREFQPAAPEHAPRDCMFAVRATDSAGRTVDTFYFDDASTFVVTSKGGRWLSSSGECAIARRGLWFAVLGFLLIGGAILSKSLRTGQWSYFPGDKIEPMNDPERILAIYGALLFAGEIIGSSECAALLVM